MNIIFFGSSEYCLPILESLHKHFTLVAIITKKGQSAEKYALSHNIDVLTPKDKMELLQLKDRVKKFNPDLAIVADYGLIIPKEIFTIPLHKTLNIHFSKLPKLRGPSPVQYTILTGKKNASISVIIMDEQMDTGDTVWQKDIELNGNETTEGLYTNLFNIVAKDLPVVLNKYVSNELKPQKQDHSLATYTKHFSREDGFIPFEFLKMAIKEINPIIKQLNQWKLFPLLFSPTDTNTGDRLHPYHLSILIDRTIRALTPWPGLWTEIIINQSKKRLKILKAHIEQLTINNHQSTILVLDLVQLEGKKPVTWKQFCEGYPDAKFEVQPQFNLNLRD